MDSNSLSITDPEIEGLFILRLNPQGISQTLI
jgi:hypothetical protein